MGIDQAEFSRRFKNSPVKRTKRRGLLRNVAVALGNWGPPEAVTVLAGALEDEEPLVRGHAAWTPGRIATGPLPSAAAPPSAHQRAGTTSHPRLRSLLFSCSFG
jgi:HEAT repeat protein